MANLIQLLHLFLQAGPLLFTCEHNETQGRVQKLKTSLLIILKEF